MVVISKGQTVNYNDKKYKVVKITHKTEYKYLVFDNKIYKKLRNLKFKWYFNDKGVLFHPQKQNDIITEIYLHDLIYELAEIKRVNQPIIHKNRIYIDNRLCNLVYRNNNKINKNMAKKTRTIELPKKCKINKNDFPTYLWYIHSDKKHGSRFFFKLADISWKSTSSKKVSDEYKFEEAKKYMRNIFKKRPDLFSCYSMNGDYNKEGKLLLKEYLEIIGDNDITEKKIDKMFGNTTKVLLKQNTKYLSSVEKSLLKNFGKDTVPNLLNIYA
jgi:hypothetical protein